MLDSTCWIGQEYWLAGDKQSQDANKLGESRYADLTAPRRSDPSLLKGTQPTHLQMGGWEGKKKNV